MKEDHEEKDKKEKTEAEKAKSEAEPMARGEGQSQIGSSDISPQGNVTQKNQPKSKRETTGRAGEADGDNREPEEKQRKVDAPAPEADPAAWTEASSSSQGPGIAPMRTEAPHKRNTVEAEPDEGEVPEKAQRIFSICVRHGAADKIGEVKAKEYDEDLKAMVEEYRARNAVGE